MKLKWLQGLFLMKKEALVKQSGFKKFFIILLCKIHKYSVTKVGFSVCYLEEHERAEKSPKVVKYRTAGHLVFGNLDRLPAM